MILTEQTQNAVFDVDGKKYYSPNSTRSSPFNASCLVEDTNPFKPQGERRSDVRYQDMRQPRIWQKAFYWMAFVPMEHWYKNYRHPPFNHLVYLPEIEWHDDGDQAGYRVVPGNGFTQLEEETYRAVAALRNKFELPCVLPFLPNTRGYLSIFRTKSQLLHTLEETREWFSVWLGALSYCIAMALTRQRITQGLKYMGYPSWRNVLKEEGFSEVWMDEMLRSPVGNYAFEVPRVGCILKIDDPHPDQPSPSWFLDLNIPIWYRSPGQCTTRTIVSKNTNNSSPLRHDRDEETDGRKEPSWVSFFAKREAKYPEILRTETDDDRRRRENRMRDKPLRKAAVFEWIQDRDDPMVWVRTPVTQKCKEETLSNYRSHQIRYDPFFNQWDCGEGLVFGDSNPDSDDEEDWGYDNDTPNVTTSS